MMTLTMGALRHLATGNLYSLSSPAVVGRSPDCMLQIADARVSNQHAELVWQGSSWIVRDLDSTNGTWLNGQVVRASRQEHRLVKKDILAFGDGTNGWMLDDDSCPQVMVVPAGGGKGIPMRRGAVRLPKSGSGLMPCIVRSGSGDWMLETGDSVLVIQPGSVFAVSGRTWRFCCPAAWQPTAKARTTRTLRESKIILRVPRNMEKIELAVQHGGEELSLGRSTSYLILVLLAQKRSRDRGEQLKEAGWMKIDQLMHALKAPETHINVWIHRIRGRLASNGFLDSAAIIERRDGTRQLRIGSDDVLIEYLTD